MESARFEWDDEKDRENQAKHGIAFADAHHAFLDPQRVIAREVGQSKGEARLYCIGRVPEGILTVRFTYRRNVIRIFGAGFWRKGRRLYEETNTIHR